ncbi:MAG: S16 family serine protease, partial [Candidatus Micrarchaeota archaeon]
PGDGSVYFSTEPLVGIYTQSSEKTAVEVAMGLANKTEGDYDVLFKISESRSARIVDGPSAGAAMTILVLAAMENKTIRRDLTITGTIEDDGIVGDVGGILDKTKAASARGLKYLVIPEQDPSSRMLLMVLLEKYNTTLVEVEDINDASEFVFAPEGTRPKKYVESVTAEQPVRSFERIPPTDSREFREFKKIVGEVLEDANGSIRALTENENADPAVISYFNARLNESAELLEKNYLYSAGNSMFLAQIDASLLARRRISKEELDAEIARADECLAGVNKKGMTDANMEWLIGAQLRLTWAEKKIAEVKEGGHETDEEVLSALREALYARSWCSVAKRMMEVEFGGAAVDESKLKESARKRIKEAEKYLETRPEEGIEDALWHLGAAQDAFEKGRYGAALFDAVYARSTTEAGEEVSVENYEEAVRMTDEITGKGMGNFWAGVYQAHAKYYRAKAASEKGEILNAYRMGKLADELEGATNAMRKEIMGGVVAKPDKGAGVGAGIDAGALLSIFAGVAVMGALSVCVLFVLFRKRHGHEVHHERKGRQATKRRR